MKSLFLRVSDKLDKIEAVIKLHQDGILTVGEIERRENEMDDDLTVLEYNGTAYEIIKKDNLPENHKVIGYSRVNRKENKKIKAKIDNLVCSIDKKVAVNEKKGTFERVVGYVKVDTSTLENFDTEGKEIYIALTKWFILPIILLFGGVALIGTIGYFNYYGLPGAEVVVPEKEQIEFVDGDKNNGEIEDKEHEFGKPVSFRMKLNCTPGVEIIDDKQQMNLRLESPAEDNAGLGFVTFVYLLGEQYADIEDDGIINWYKDIIYEEHYNIFDENNIIYGTIDNNTIKWSKEEVYYIYDKDSVSIDNMKLNGNSEPCGKIDAEGNVEWYQDNEQDEKYYVFDDNSILYGTINKNTLTWNRHKKFCIKNSSNEYFATVDRKNIIEEYAEPIEIYQSPLVYADENIEWCPLHTEVESGIYVGRALYYVFDENENLLGQTASRLKITVK